MAAIKFDTAQLAHLRKIIGQFPALRASIGEIAKFRLVVDANFVIQELIHAVRCPNHGASAFEEMVKASVIEIFAPRWLETEMTVAITKAAKRSKVSESALLAKWTEFRGLLNWDETLREPGEGSVVFCDPKDHPYILLERKLRADGILTKDIHIARMGGHPLTHDFVFCTRSYARSAVTTASIQAISVLLPAAVGLVVGDLSRQIAKGFAALPDPIKALLITGAAVAVLHPGSRKWLINHCSDAYEFVAPAFGSLLEIAGTLAATSVAARAEASKHLQEARRVVRPKRSNRIKRPTHRSRGLHTILSRSSIQNPKAIVVVGQVGPTLGGKVDLIGREVGPVSDPPEAARPNKIASGTELKWRRRPEVTRKRRTAASP